MLIMGIDPGTVQMGVGIVEYKSGSFKPVFYDVLKMSSKESIPDRIGKIFNYITKLLREYPVKTAAVEDVFTSINFRSALKLGQAKGAVIAAVKNAGLEILEYTPKEVKISVCGYGGADKEQVKKIVEMLLGLKIKGAYDITDALAIAVCHANHSALRGVINDRVS